MQNRLDQPVDMMEIARETTRRDTQRLPRGAVKVLAPAKVNLHLHVGARRPDGYHDVENVMQTIMLHDVVYLWPLDGAAAGTGTAAETGAAAAAASGVDVGTGMAAAAAGTSGTCGKVTCECVACEGLTPVDIAPEENLAVRAVRALAAEVFGTADAAPGVGIRIEKHVPAQAGLGGGSSDAAASLVGAAHLWVQAGAADAAAVSSEVLAHVAAKLGADVPFFLTGGAALMGGTGTEFVRAFASRKDSAVIIQPEVGLSTAAMYATIDEAAAGGESASFVPDTWDGVSQASDIPLANDFQAPAVAAAPVIGEIIAFASAQPGVTAAMLSGSGSAVFAICTDFSSACKLAANAKLAGWWARTTAFGPVRAAVTPV